MDETLGVGADGLKALADSTRSTILTLVEGRPASVTQLAAAMDRPKGSIAHHVKVLEEAGLIRVVDTRKVRAITERFYGRTARWFLLSGFDDGALSPHFSIHEALGRVDVATGIQHKDALSTARYARIPAERAAEFGEALLDVVDRFVGAEPGGDTVYAMVAGIFPTTLPTLEDAE